MILRLLLSYALVLYPLQGVGGKAGMGGKAGEGGGVNKHTFSDVQQADCSVAGTGGTCAFSGGTLAGSLIFVAAENSSGSNAHISSVTSSSDTLTVPATCQDVNGSVGSVSCADIISGAGGQTTYTFAFDVTSSNYIVHMFEVSYTGAGSVTLDGTPATNSNSASTTPSGIAPTGMSGVKDACFQWTVAGGTITGIGTANGYGNFAGGLFRGFADGINLTTPSTVLIWAQSSSAITLVAGACFK